MSNFPESPIDGALAEVANADGSAVQYRYDKAEAAWKIVGKIGGADLQVVTTKDVVTTSEPPLAPAGWTGFNVQEDIQYLTNQKLINWYLAEQILINKGNSDRPPIISISPPVSHPKFPSDSLEEGDFWIDSNSIMHYWNGSEWKEVLDSEFYTGNYVKKAGDTMTGDLQMDNAGFNLRNGHLDIGIAKPKADLQDVDQRFTKIKSYAPIDTDINATNFDRPYGIDFVIDDGNSFKNTVKVSNRNGDVVSIGGGTGPAISFGNGFPGNQDKVAPGSEGGVKIKGIPTPDFLTADGDVAVNKQYVDERDAFLQNEIIELEEEIDAIAPSVERGKWRFTAVGTVAQPGQFTMYDDEFGSGSPTGLFRNVKSIWFNQIDSEGTAHAFGDVDDGELLEIFIDGSPEFGLYEVKGQAHDETDGASSFWVIDVNFIRTNEDTTAVAPSELCRFKIFMAPTGGDSSSFVMKTGDEMSGKLTLSNTYALNLKGKIQINGSTTSSRFLGTNSSGNMEWKTALTSQTKSDWNQSNSSNAAYIYNKPTVVTGSTSGIKITSSNGNYYIEG